jgi:hypothetical protein
VLDALVTTTPPSCSRCECAQCTVWFSQQLTLTCGTSHRNTVFQLRCDPGQVLKPSERKQGSLVFGGNANQTPKRAAGSTGRGVGLRAFVRGLLHVSAPPHGSAYDLTHPVMSYPGCGWAHHAGTGPYGILLCLRYSFRWCWCWCSYPSP